MPTFLKRSCVLGREFVGGIYLLEECGSLQPLAKGLE